MTANQQMSPEEFLRLKPGDLIRDCSGDFFLVSHWLICEERHWHRIALHPISLDKNNEWHGFRDTVVRGTMERLYTWDLTFKPWENCRRVA